MSAPPTALEHARAAFARRAWREARDAFVAARATAALSRADLGALAVVADLVGDDDLLMEALDEAHAAAVEAGASVEGARWAFWMGFHLITRGEMAAAGGWFGRARRLLEQTEDACVERGYLLLPVALRALEAGELEQARTTAEHAIEMAQRFREPDLLALALHVEGRALLRSGQLPEGLARLDEAMVAVARGETSPPVTGVVYCAVIAACREVWELRRAQEWTTALTRWCDGQPDLVPFAGECLVFRAEILQRRGEWEQAFVAAHRALECAQRSGKASVVGAAHYQQAELHRTRGSLERAEAAYQAASREGLQPLPGLAALRLHQGDVTAAHALLRRALAETPAAHRRARLLPTWIDVLLRRGDVGGAEDAAAELTDIARRFGSDTLEATAARARGAVALARGAPEDGVAPLRIAADLWESSGVPHETARTRVLLAAACRAMGDAEGAALEEDAARRTFAALGIDPDRAPLDAPGGAADEEAHDFGLTPREREVLALLATGLTNRALGERLGIREKTVARHVANLYGKLGLSSRAAATAFAYEHGLLGGPA